MTEQFCSPEVIRQPSLGTGYRPVLLEKKRIFDVYGAELERTYLIRLIFYPNFDNLDDEEELEIWPVESLEDLNFPRFWDVCCDRDLDAASKRERALMLHQQAARMQFTDYTRVNRLGILPNKKIPFVYCSGKIVTSEPESVDCIFASGLPEFHIDTTISHEEQMKCFRSIMEFRPGVLDIMFCLRLLAVLKPLLNECRYPELFIGMIYGEFGSGKTELAKFMFESDDLQMRNFIRDNAIPLQKYMDFWSGHALILDDFHPAGQTHWDKKQKANLDLVARYADKGTGALVIATGEMLAGSASLQDRMIPVYVEKTDDLTQRLGELWESKAALETLIWEFAKKVYTNKDASVEIIRKFYGNWAVEGQEFRIVRNKNFLFLAICLFAKIFPDAEYSGLGEQLKDSIQTLEKRHVVHMRKVQRIASGADWTDEVFRMFNEQQIDKDFEFSNDYSGLQEVVIENNRLYITSNELNRRLQEYLSMKINVKEVAEHMDLAGVLETDNSRARTKKHRGRYYYVINRPLLELYHQRVNKKFK